MRQISHDRSNSNIIHTSRVAEARAEHGRLYFRIFTNITSSICKPLSILRHLSTPTFLAIPWSEHPVFISSLTSRIDCCQRFLVHVYKWNQSCHRGNQSPAQLRHSSFVCIESTMNSCVIPSLKRILITTNLLRYVLM